MGGKLSRPVYLAPHLLGYQSKIILLILLILIYLIVKMYQLKHNSIQIQLFSLSECSVCLVSGVGGKLSRPVYLDPHPPEYQSNFFLLILLILNYLIVKMYQLKPHSSEIQLFSLSDCSVYLVTGVGGKLSRPVYLDPHPPEYQSKIILLSFLILNYLNVMMYQL